MKIRNMMAMAAGAAACMAPAALMADEATPAPLQSQVQTHLRLDIKDDVKEVHFVNTNNDPYVYTKVYVLKNADPYEIRPYLITAVGGYWTPANTYNPLAMQGRRVDSSNTKVECIKYMDGVGALIISAEDYRFTKEGNDGAMSIDEVVNILDLPDNTSSSGHDYMIYFPKYWTATDLAVPLKRVGLNGNDQANFASQWELEQGKDRVRVDTYLNALFFYFPAYSKKHFTEMLAQYDKPNPEVLLTYSVYEFDNEIDSQVGDDFQAWKNGPGTDLFAVGARYVNGWDTNTMNVNHTANSNSSKFLNFSPKWNTKYIDFLAAEGKAQVVTSGTLSLMNNKTGFVGSTVRYPTIVDGAARASSGVTQVRYYQTPTTAGDTAANVSLNVKASSATTDYNAITNPNGDTVPTTTTYSLYTEGGVKVNTTMLGGTSAKVRLTVTETQFTNYNGNGATNVQYIYYFSVSPVNGTAYFVDVNGASLGQQFQSAASATQINFTVSGAGGSAVSWSTSSTDSYAAMAIQHATQRNSSIQSNGTDVAYGFQMTVANPVVSETTTQLPLVMQNTNLIGFNSDGSPRTSLAKVSQVVNVNNKGEKFVLGGLHKEQVIRSTNKVPWLGDIPVVSWAVNSEREIHKKSQLVAVIEAVPVLPDTTVADKVMGQINDAKTKIDNYGVKAGFINENDYGFDQFLLDSEKKSLDPLP